MASKEWLEITIEPDGAGIRARATSSLGGGIAPYSLGPEFTLEKLALFSQQVRTAAERHQPLGEHLPKAQQLYRALFQESVRIYQSKLEMKAHGNPLLLRLVLADEATLRAFPWEALCVPDATIHFLGSAPEILLARGVELSEPCESREIRTAVRVLAIAPFEEYPLEDQEEGPLGEQLGSTLQALRFALESRIASGAVEWLEPLVGPRASFSRISTRLKQEPCPHIIHFIGHGRVDKQGAPRIRMADEGDEEKWVQVEALAQQLQDSFRRSLRLIVLDACNGASPGALASAAEWFVSYGADAVVAHLWPVKTDVIRAYSRVFYETLTQNSVHPGDVAYSLHEARREVIDRFDSSAEAFSPVLYLRDRDSTLFDFRVQPILPRPPSPRLARPADNWVSILDKIRRQPFTLVLGDDWEVQRAALKKFSKRLHQGLSELGGDVPAEVPCSTIAQLYELHFEEQKLSLEFQEMFGAAATSMPLMDGVAQMLCPGVHVTLLLQPLLETALATLRPELTIHVIQPPGRRGNMVTVRRREARSTRWDTVNLLPRDLDPEEDVVVLRLYCGYLPPLPPPPMLFMPPLLTEDDYLLGVNELNAMLSSDLADLLLGVLNTRPALILRMSMLTWHHRMLLYRLCGVRPLSRDSVVVLDPRNHERELWERRRIPPTRDGIQVLELTDEELAAYFGWERKPGEPPGEEPPAIGVPP